jgi:hypothetical protein
MSMSLILTATAREIGSPARKSAANWDSGSGDLNLL